MKKIIGMLRPFQMEQTLMVYEDGNKIDIAKSSVEEFHNTIFNLMDKHQTYRIDLVGPKKYSQGLANQIREASEKQTKYQLNEIEINII